MWAVLKRGLYGTWHMSQGEREAPGRYVSECVFRLNEEM